MSAEKLRTTSFQAQCNGGVERVNKVINPCLAKLIDIDQDDWDVYLPMAISSYNNSFQSSIKMTPYEAHYCRPGVLVPDIILNNPLPTSTQYKDVNQYLVSLWENAQRLQGVVRENLAEARLKQKAQYDKNVRDNHNFKIGDLVWIHSSLPQLGLTQKLLPRFEGPFEVIEKVDQVTYRVRNETRMFPTHVQRMLPYHKWE
jgi:hypothetical protein